MISASPALLFLAIASGASSVVSLRLAWRKKSGSNTLLVCAGWAALLLSVVLWSQVHGTEFGVSYALAWLALCAAVALILNREYRPPQADTAASQATALTTTGQKWLTFLSAGPVAFCAAVPLTLLVTLLLPMARVNQMAIAAVLFPTLWALAAYWVSAHDKPGRWGVVFLATSLASTAGLLFMAASL